MAKDENLFEEGKESKKDRDQIIVENKRLKREIEELKIQLRLEYENAKRKTIKEDPKEDHGGNPLLKPTRTIGLILSGDVHVTELENEIIDQKEFQRLRRIKQLGSSNLVYPSVLHTRFEHVLGVLKIAENMVNKILNNRHNEPEEKRIDVEQHVIVRLMALLHDIGHMPYGHTIEDEFSIFPSHDKNNVRWQYFLGDNSAIGGIIIRHLRNYYLSDYYKKNESLTQEEADKKAREFHKRFYELIICEKKFSETQLKEAFMYDIISNTICADLLDYLERDCLHAALELKFHKRFLDYFFIKNISDDPKKPENRIVIRVYKKGKLEQRKDTLSELVQLLKNRYYLGERVYYHHTKIKTGTLIAGAVLRANQAGLLKPLRGQEDIKQEKDRLLTIHIMDDEQLVNYLVDSAKHEIKKAEEEGDILTYSAFNPKQKNEFGAYLLAKRFKERIIYHELIYKTKNDLNIHDEFDVKYLIEYEEQLAEYETQLADGKAEGKTPPKIDKVKVANPLSRQIYRKYIQREASAEYRLSVENDIEEYLPDIKSGDFLIYCPHFNMQMKLAKAKIENEEGMVFELRQFPDDSIRHDCDSILLKHQHLWAIRVLIHPGIKEIPNYLELLEHYCDWRIFSKNEKEERKKAKKFFEEWIPIRLRQIESEGYNSPNLKNHDYEDTVKSFAANMVEQNYSKENKGKDSRNLTTELINKFKLTHKA